MPLRSPARYLLAALLLCVPLWAAADEGLVLVAHPDSPVAGVDTETVAALYLGLRTGLDGLPGARPLDLKDRKLREKFYGTVTNRNLAQLRAHWSKLVFTGKGRPPRAMSVEDMAATLRNDPEAIGYLPVSASQGLRHLLPVP